MIAPNIMLQGSAHIGGAPLFARLHLALAAGQWTCLLGGSGVGKSTLLRLIADLATGVTFDGDIVADDGLPVAPRIAFMAQDHLLMPWATIVENVMVGARLRAERADPARARHMLAQVGLQEHGDKLPAELSGGQRQRVALARTLMEDKPVILLDEPFSALDLRTRSEMQALAVRLLAGRTVLLVTHDPLEAARLGHSIQLMDQSGLQDISAPAGLVPREEDAADVLAAQGKLMRALKEGWACV